MGVRSNRFARRTSSPSCQSARAYGLLLLSSAVYAGNSQARSPPRPARESSATRVVDRGRKREHYYRINPNGLVAAQRLTDPATPDRGSDSSYRHTLELLVYLALHLRVVQALSPPLPNCQSPYPILCLKGVWIVLILLSKEYNGSPGRHVPLACRSTSLRMVGAPPLLLENVLRRLKMHLCNAPQSISARLSNEDLADGNNIWIGTTFWQHHLYIPGKSFQVLKKCRPRKD